MKDSLLPMGKVWSLDFLGIYVVFLHTYIFLLVDKGDFPASHVNLQQYRNLHELVLT